MVLKIFEEFWSLIFSTCSELAPRDLACNAKLISGCPSSTLLQSFNKLLKDEIISKDLDQIRDLFDEIEKKTTFVNILENAGSAKGVQIFIGAQNFLFNHTGISMVMAPYTNKEQKIIGAIGVLGPMRINYARIVPLVDYTSKIIGRIMG